MRRMMKTLAIAALCAIATSSVARAQEGGGGAIGGDGTCNFAMDSCSGTEYAHYMHNGTSYGGSGHSDCMVCLTAGNPTTGDNCHVCDGEDEATKLAYTAVLQAGRLGDVTSVLKLAARTKGHVVYNSARGSVQILSCDRGRPIANLLVKTEAQRSLAVALSRPEGGSKQLALAIE